METKQFLSTVLGDEGHYCVLGLKDKARKQTFYNSIDSLIDAATELDNDGFNAYFALATFKEAENRTSENVLQLRALFLDLDCGEGKPYPTKTEALAALLGFCKAYELPAPSSVINSGYGLHVYWALSRPYSRADWLPVAERLKAACHSHGLHADHAVTADAARILRLPNTHNRKNGGALPVQIERCKETYTDLENFASKLPESLIPVTAVREFTEADKEDMERAAGFDNKYEYSFHELLQLSGVDKGCNQIKRAILNPNDVTYDQWLHLLATAKHTTEAAQAIHLISKGYKDYDPEETDKIAESIKKPHLCITFEKDCPSGCEGCIHKGKHKTPLGIVQRLRKAETNTVEVVVDEQAILMEGEEVIASDQQVAPKVAVHTVPDYPGGYFRTANGGVGLATTDDKGERQEIEIYDRDLYVTRRLKDPIFGPIFEFKHHTAREGIQTFVVKGSELSKNESFRTTMAMNDIHLLADDAKKLMTYVNKWVRHLVDTADAVTVRTQFGWTENMKSFVVGNREIFPYEIKENPPGGRTAQYFPMFNKKGTLEDWKNVTSFYNREGFEEHQFMFGLSFGSPLMEFIPNISGALYHLTSSETGLGKTTGMWGGASVWGNHKKLVLKGKDTGNSAWNRAEIFKNLPLYIDETSNFKPKDASDFVYAISDGEQKNRLSNSGQNEERYRGEEWSLLGGTSGNKSLLETMMEYRALPKGEAGRVIEGMVVKKLFGPEDTLRANSLNDDLAKNYGHAGEVYIQHILQTVEETEKLVLATRDKLIMRAKLEPSHRHWAAECAVVFAGCVIAKELELIDWDLHDLWRWIIKKLKMLKIEMKEMMIDIHDLVGQYYQAHVRNILRIRSTDDARGDPVKENILNPQQDRPMYKWVGRHETDINRLYLLPTPFKEWCISKGHHFSAISQLVEIHMNGKKKKVRLGKGTNLDISPQHCWIMDFRYDEFAASNQLDADLVEGEDDDAGDAD
jgi:hypothetical protein